MDHFITELRTRAKPCEFDDQHVSVIRDRIVFGVSDACLKERLLRESSDLTREKATSLCRAAEESEKQLKDVKTTFDVWQVRLDEESSQLFTFNNLFGRYRLKRMPFGISSAPEVFQKKNEVLFRDIDGM